MDKIIISYDLKDGKVSAWHTVDKYTAAMFKNTFEIVSDYCSETECYFDLQNKLEHFNAYFNQYRQIGERLVFENESLFKEKTETKNFELENMAAALCKLKNLLAETDFQAIKFADGEIGVDDYALTRTNRRAIIAQISEITSKSSGRLA